MTSPIKVPTYYGLAPATNLYANQYYAYVPINGVPTTMTQQTQPAIVAAPFYPNVAALPPTTTSPRKVVTKGWTPPKSTSSRSVPNMNGGVKDSGNSSSNVNVGSGKKRIVVFVDPCEEDTKEQPDEQNQAVNDVQTQHVGNHVNNNNNNLVDEDDTKEKSQSPSHPSSEQSHEVTMNSHVLSQPQLSIPQYLPSTMVSSNHTMLSMTNGQLSQPQPILPQQPPQVILLGDSDIIKSIDSEMASTKHKKGLLNVKVAGYHIELNTLKNNLAACKRKIAILDKVIEADADWKHYLQDKMSTAEFDFNTYSQTYEQRLYHERQLEIVHGQHLNLKSMAESLSARLRKVVQEYQSLDASLDPADTRCVHGDWRVMDHAYSPDGCMAISNNAHFKDLVAQNRKLERQIRFIKDIIKQEEARNDNGCSLMPCMPAKKA